MYKVDGSGNRWHVWKWGVQGDFWSIISNHLTKRAAVAAMIRNSQYDKSSKRSNHG